MRMLAMESPRIAQSFAEMGIKLSTLAPYLGAVAAAAAADSAGHDSRCRGPNGSVCINARG